MALIAWKHRTPVFSAFVFHFCACNSRLESHRKFISDAQIQKRQSENVLQTYADKWLAVLCIM